MPGGAFHRDMETEALTPAATCAGFTGFAIAYQFGPAGGFHPSFGPTHSHLACQRPQVTVRLLDLSGVGNWTSTWGCRRDPACMGVSRRMREGVRQSGRLRPDSDKISVPNVVFDAGRAWGDLAGARLRCDVSG